MNPRRGLLVLALVFGFLMIILLFQESNAPALPPPIIPPTSMPETTPTPLLLLRVFPDLTVLDIQAIRLENPETGAELTLQRDASGQWTSPGRPGQLDPEAATTIARTLVLLPYGRSINILTSTSLDDYGFGTAGQFLIQIIVKNGEGYGVIVGAADDVDPVYYALVDDRDEIFRLERGPVDFLIQMLNSPPINLTN